MLRSRVALASLVLAVLPAAFGACSTSGAASAGSSGTGAVDPGLGAVVDLTGKAEVSIDVVDNSYTPQAFEVSPGTKVTYTNKGANVHNVTPAVEGDFTEISLTPGDSKSIVAPYKPGTFKFYCTIHGGLSSGQRGQLIVVAPR